MTDKAAALYPYVFPADIVQRYASPDDLTLWEKVLCAVKSAENTPIFVGADGAPLKIEGTDLTESDFEKALRIGKAAQDKYIADTIQADFELYKELCEETAKRYTLDDALADMKAMGHRLIESGVTDEKRKKIMDEMETEREEIDKKTFAFFLYHRMIPLAVVSDFYGWDKMNIAETAVHTRIVEIFGEDQSGDGADDLGEDQPPTKKKTGKAQKQTHIELLPQQLLCTLDPLNHYAMNGLFPIGKSRTVELFRKKKRLPDGKYMTGDPVEVFAIFEYEGTDIAQRLDIVDGAILRGIYSLLDVGEMRFSVSHIWELIAGKGQRTNSSRIEDIIIRIRRMIGTTVKISYSQLAEAKGMDYTDDITAQILPGVILRERRNKRGDLIGAEIVCKFSLETFPLYQFAEITGQITHAPLEAVTVRGLTAKYKPQALTDAKIVVREMICQRIIKQHRNKSDQIILFSTLYEKVKADSKIERQRVRDAAESFLCEWAELGTVYNYAFRKKGKAIDAIVIAKDSDEMQNFDGLQWLVNRK